MHTLKSPSGANACSAATVAEAQELLTEFTQKEARGSAESFWNSEKKRSQLRAALLVRLTSLQSLQQDASQILPRVAVRSSDCPNIAH